MSNYLEERFPNGRWLLCPPTYFDVKYEINPWMHIEKTPNHARAAMQWKILHHTILRLGGFIDYIQPSKENPDLVFTANAGLVKNNKAVLSKFKYQERQGEENNDKTWFLERGFEVVEIENGFFEGEGDALFAGNKLFCGYPFRSDEGVYAQIQEALEIEKIIMCELVDERFYHLDTCFCPLNDNLALIYEKAFSDESLDRIKNEINLISVSEENAVKFVCNAVVLGKDIVLPADCDKTYQELLSHGFESHPVELDEFLKGGGSAKCLTLRLDRK